MCSSWKANVIWYAIAAELLSSSYKRIHVSSSHCRHRDRVGVVARLRPIPQKNLCRIYSSVYICRCWRLRGDPYCALHAPFLRAYFSDFSESSPKNYYPTDDPKIDLYYLLKVIVQLNWIVVIGTGATVWEIPLEHHVRVPAEALWHHVFFFLDTQDCFFLFSLGLQYFVSYVGYVCLWWRLGITSVCRQLAVSPWIRKMLELEVDGKPPPCRYLVLTVLPPLIWSSSTQAVVRGHLWGVSRWRTVAYRLGRILKHAEELHIGDGGLR